MRKILIASDSGLPRWDGVARFLSEIVPRIREEFETTVMTPDFKGKDYRFNKAIHIKVPLMKMSIADYNPAKPPIKALDEVVKQVDVVFCQTLGPIGALSIYYARKHKKKVVYYVHSIEWELVTKGMNLPSKVSPKLYTQLKSFVKSMYAKCDVLLVPTKEIMQMLHDEGVKTKMVLLPIGVDLERFFAPKHKRHAQAVMDLPTDKPIIGFAGRIAREKDLPTLLRAFDYVRLKVPCRLLIVGSGNQEYMDMLKKDKDIIAVGSVDNPEPYYRAMDVFVLPSLTETSSLATMEAMASGLPCVTTPVGIMKTDIKNWVNGVKFPQGNAVDLSEKLVKLLKSEQLRKRIGKEARRTVRKYDWKITAEKIVRELDAV